MSALTPAPKGYAIKLVRDKTPRIINSSGQPGGLFYRQVDLDARVPWLKRKLIEEAAEYLESGELDELADVLAVIEGIAWARHGLTLAELASKMHDDKRGGFLHGQMMYGYHEEFDG